MGLIGDSDRSRKKKVREGGFSGDDHFLVAIGFSSPPLNPSLQAYLPKNTKAIFAVAAPIPPPPHGSVAQSCHSSEYKLSHLVIDSKIMVSSKEGGYQKLSQLEALNQNKIWKQRTDIASSLRFMAKSYLIGMTPNTWA
ncbi:hypothetical protein VNO77_26670 [Canavalia gladiata]|uniref:Uncharacterized protein n=1 Tax=Canavalia gladiata TaxID=3824 RepID=A0AAN9KU03_CANGL